MTNEILKAQLERYGTEPPKPRPQKMGPKAYVRLGTPPSERMEDSPPPAVMLASRGPQKARERLRRERTSPSSRLSGVTRLVKTRTRKKAKKGR